MPGTPQSTLYNIAHLILPRPLVVDTCLHFIDGETES